MGDGVAFYDRDGADIGFETWLHRQTDPAYRHVASITIGDIAIRTTWVGTHADPFHPPLIFQTTVAGPTMVRRYLWPTEADAVAGHVRLVEWLTDPG